MNITWPVLRKVIVPSVMGIVYGLIIWGEAGASTGLLGGILSALATLVGMRSESYFSKVDAFWHADSHCGNDPECLIHGDNKNGNDD